MTEINTIEYASKIESLAKWNYTTYARTHYNVKPHIATAKFESLSNRSFIKAVWGVTEPDGGYYEKLYDLGGKTPMNHMHLLMEIDDGIFFDLKRWKEFYNRNIKDTSKGEPLFEKKERWYSDEISKAFRKAKDQDIIAKKYTSGELTRDIILEEVIKNGLDVRKSQLGKLEEVKNLKSLASYISKHLNNINSHHDFFINKNFKAPEKVGFEF